MSVYVDDAIWPFGRMMMCHMIADTLEELHAMADRIGVQRKWFQDKRIKHYDISTSKRAIAVASGAIEVDRRQFVHLTKKQEGLVPEYLMCDGTWRIEEPAFVAGFVIERGYVTWCAPILRKRLAYWMTRATIVAYATQEVPDHDNAEPLGSGGAPAT